MSSIPDVALGDTIGGYVIDSLLGRGGMGEVYLAHDGRLDRPVALKVIAPAYANDPAFRSRFDQEARITLRLEHPNVVPVYDVGEDGGRLYLAMRVVDGRDLASLLREGEDFPGPRVSRITAQVCAALDAAHSRGLVHRDIKPANVLLTHGRESEHVYLTDFGLARDSAATSGVTETGQWIGTVDYAAPEQISGQAVDARTDVYAVACLAFQLLTGCPPFEGGVAAKLHGHLTVAPRAASDLTPEVPRRVSHVLAQGMAKDPEDRFQSAGGLARALEAAFAGSPLPTSETTVAMGEALTGVTQVAARPTSIQPSRPEQRSPKPPRKRPPAEVTAAAQPRERRSSNLGGIVLAGLALIGAVVVAILALQRSDAPAPATQANSGTTVVQTTTVAAPERRKRAPARTTVPPSDEQGFWSVGLASTRTRSGAEATLQRARAAGLNAHVVDSDLYPSLTAGYWFVYAGPYANRQAAREAAVELDAAGFDGAYARFVGPAASATTTNAFFGGNYRGIGTQYAPRGTTQEVEILVELADAGGEVMGTQTETITSSRGTDVCSGDLSEIGRSGATVTLRYTETANPSSCVPETVVRLTRRSGTLEFSESYELSAGTGSVQASLSPQGE